MAEKIALAVIADDNAMKDRIDRMIDSVKDKVDALFVAFTGNDLEVAKQINNHVARRTNLKGQFRQIPWENFSFARNASFALIPQGEYDFIFWLDCDDVLPEEVDLQAACREIRARGAHAAFMDYHYKVDVERDVVLMSHQKERLFRSDIDWEWIYPIHENCVGPMGARSIKLDPSQFYVRHLRSGEEGKRDRNKQMIADWFKAEGDREPRAVMFMAHQTFALAEDAPTDAEKTVLYKTALKLYQRFISLMPANEDVYVCNRQCAEILRALGRYDDALNIDLQGIKAEPTWPSSYVGMAETHFQAGGYEDAIKWADLAINLWFDESLIPIHDRLEAKYRPMMIRGASLLALGRSEEAAASFEFALTIYDDEFTRSQLEAARQPVVIDTTHEDAKLIHDRNMGARPEQSIAFFVPPTIEDWNPDLLSERGAGGTETCIIRLAENLADLGWRVAVFGQPGPWEGRMKGSTVHPKGRVEWYRSGSYHPDEFFKVFVALRSCEIFDMKINADLKIMWLHDISMGDVRHSSLGDRFSKCDAIVCPSPFHVEHTMKVYEYSVDPWSAKNHSIANGFDREVFVPEDESRNLLRMAYASSPDRGLPRLLDLWPDIAKRVPGAQLDIYYGWDSIDAIIERGLPTAPMLAWFKQNTQQKIDKLIAKGHRINWIGRVDQATLAEEFKKTGLIVYPANFMETFGIVFAQAMTAGVVPVVSDLGALPTTVGEIADLGVVVPGSPDSIEFGERFVSAVADAVNTTSDKRRYLTEWTHYLNWNHIAREWEVMIEKELEA